MSDKVLVDKKDIVDIANVAQRLNYNSFVYYRRFKNWWYQGVKNDSDYTLNNSGVGRPQSGVLTRDTSYVNKWITKTFEGANRICADVYYGLNTKATAICIVKQGRAPAKAPSTYSSDYTAIDGYITHFSMMQNSSEIEKMQRMLRESMYCTNVPQANQKHFEVEGDTISLGFNIPTSSSYYSPPTGYSYKQYGVCIIFYDPDSIRQAEDTDANVDTSYNMGGTDNFYNVGYEEEWSDIKKALLNYMPASTYLDIKSNGIFYGNGGYVDVNVASNIKTMNRVQITATNTTVSNLKRRTYDLSSYLTNQGQAFFLRLYVQGTSSSSGSSSGYVEFLFSPLFMDLNTGTSVTTMPTSASGGYNMWMKKSSSSSTYSSSASPAVNTASVLWNVSNNPWSYCSWNWNPSTKVLYIQNNSSSSYYPSSEKAVLYYVAS